MLDEKGEHLCNRLQSKWYQEGERGTKYFLNMQRARGNKLDMIMLKNGDQEINDPDQINKITKLEKNKKQNTRNFS